jgi:hypothetical protein
MPSRERARHAMLLLKSMLVRGLLGADPETVAAIADLEQFVEEVEMPTELPLPPSPDAEVIGRGSTTLDYLKIRHQWLGLLIDDAEAELKRLREKVAALEEQLRDAHRGKPAFELLAADLARASGLPASATWQEHIAACVAVREQVAGHCARIAQQSELLARLAEKDAA